jgi:hypothetical protein
MTLDPSTGIVSGTPNVAGSTTVTVTVTDSFKQAGTRSFTWTVTPLSVGSFTVPASKSGTAITPVTMTAAGGIPPYVSWSATGLPTGLVIDPGTGTISGTPTQAKTFANVVISVTDSSADAGSHTASRTVSTWKVS